MLESTNEELPKIFFALGTLSRRIVQLKEAEAAETSPDSDTVETLEEMDDIICGLPGLFDTEDDSFDTGRG